MYATSNSQPPFNTLVWSSLKPATTNLERHLGGEEVSKCPLGTQCSARQNTRKVRLKATLTFTSSYRMLTVKKKNKHKPS